MPEKDKKVLLGNTHNTIVFSFGSKVLRPVSKENTAYKVKFAKSNLM